MTYAKEFGQAARLYERFTGHKAAPLADVPAPRTPRVGVLVGTADFLGYTTMRDGETQKYIHRFHAADKPLFVVSPDGRRLMLVDGRFQFTERGIVDESERARNPIGDADMAGQLLLVNPARRRRRKNAMPAGLKRYWATHRRKGRRANPHHRRRRRNAIVPSYMSMAANPRRRRRRNPLFMRNSHRRHRRRRNPISMGAAMEMLKAAAIGAGGGIALDYLFGYVNNMVPATMKRTPGTIGIGDAVKVVFNVAVGSLLDGPTRGMARKAATGSMTVHFYQLISQQLPTTIQSGLASAGGGLGWYQPVGVVQGTRWVGPNRVSRGTPLLSAFVRGSPSLSGVQPGMAPQLPTVASVAAGVPIR